MRNRRIGIVAIEGVQLLDVAGPADVFSIANNVAPKTAARYETALLAIKNGPVVTESGVRLCADVMLSRCGLLDTIVVPGGHGVRADGRTRAAIAAWLRESAPRARRVASVCTGIYALAESGF